MTFFSDYCNMEEKRQRRIKKIKKIGEGGYQIVDRIDNRLSELGMSRTDLTAEIKKKKGKFALNTLANWSKRKTIPAADIALFIADTIKCSVRWIITGDDKDEIYTLEEKNLISDYRALGEQGRFEIKTLITAKKTAVDDKETIPEITTAAEKKWNAG